MQYNLAENWIALPGCGPIETIEQQVQLDITQTDYGTYLSDESFAEKLEAALGIGDSVKVEVTSTLDIGTTGLIVLYNINIYADSTETQETLKATQDQLYKGAVAGTTELLLGGSIYNMCYDDCSGGTYVIYEGAEALELTGSFGNRRLSNS